MPANVATREDDRRLAANHPDNMSVVRDYNIIKLATIDAWPQQEIADETRCSLAHVQNVLRDFYKEARSNLKTDMQDRWTAWQMRMENLYRQVKTQVEAWVASASAENPLDYNSWLDSIKVMTAIAVVSQKIDGTIVNSLGKAGTPWNVEDESSMSEQAVAAMVKLHGLRVPQTALPESSTRGGSIVPAIAQASTLASVPTAR